jgi:polar amino acid transport system permease protein
MAQSTNTSIKAVPLRHPFRWAAALYLALVAVAFLVDASHRSAYDWKSFNKYVFDARVFKAAGVTLSLTIISMFFAILLGVALAVMRRSPNPVFRNVAWIFIWIFRGTPVYVQLVFWGLLSTIYHSFFIGIPDIHFGHFYLGVHFPISQTASLYWLAIIGLSLNEAAYMAEIVRAGLLSVDGGQEEAAKSLGMSWWTTMRFIVIPQAMRIIIPPTGNEIVSMLKTTSLVTAVPLVTDLYARTRNISDEIYNPIPLLMVACAWYLFFTTILMFVQYFVEKRFARGHSPLIGVQS